MIRWLFFDVGNVILNDDPGMAMIYRRLYNAVRAAGHDLSFEQLLAEREELILTRNDGLHHWTLGRRYLGEDGWMRLRDEYTAEWAANYDRYNLPLAGAGEVIHALAADYSLGLAANQVPACRDALERAGLLRHFRVHGISATIGLAKPSPDFFRWLLDRAGCRPEESIMIGDRIDVDIRPARALGMGTIWVRLPLEAKGYAPADPLGRLYFESQQRIGLSRVAARDEEETPDATVTSLDGIPGAVAAIAADA
ncbi:MAG: HAD family hydrolase [Planctomycetota bacterium]|jgi:HAD superfamily hydrolase (TIGR01509 family)